MTLIRIFCCFKTPIRNGFCHSFHRGGRGSYEDQLVILVYVILGGRGGGVEQKMHDVILFAVFFLKASLIFSGIHLQRTKRIAVITDKRSDCG